MPSDLSAARQLFFDYACSHFFMWHDGMLDSYRQIGASEADEQIWRVEYIAYWIKRLSLDELIAINRLGDAQGGEALANLIKLAEQGDGYAQLWYANAIWELAETPGVPSNMMDHTGIIPDERL